MATSPEKKNSEIIDELVDDQINFRDALYNEMSLEERERIIDNIHWLWYMKAREENCE